MGGGHQAPLRLSKKELQPELNLPRISNTCYTSYRGRDRDVRRRPAEVRVIWEIEELRPKLQRRPLVNFCVLEHTYIEYNIAGRKQMVARAAPKRKRRGDCISGSIEPAILRPFGAGKRTVANHVRAPA